MHFFFINLRFLFKDFTSSCAKLPSSSYILEYAQVPDGFCPFIFASGLNRPRGIFVVGNGDVLVLESGSSRVTIIYQDQNGKQQKAQLAAAPELNHAVTGLKETRIVINNLLFIDKLILFFFLVHDNYLYASSSRTVYRWKYQVGQRSDLGTPQIVINSIPCCHHVTRSLVFDSQGRLYVQ